MSEQTTNNPPGNHHYNPRRQVLSEEEYQANLQQVVQRQYFPDLPLLSQTAALYERRAAGDVAGAVAIRRAMRQRQDAEEAEQQMLVAAAATGGTGTGTALQLATTAITSTNATTTTTPTRPLHLTSLTDFHARVTSEDNADFAVQQAQDVEANRKRQRLEYNSWASINARSSVSSSAIRALPPSNTYVASPLPLASDQFNPSPYRKSLQQYAQDAEQAPIQNNLLFLPDAGHGTGGSNNSNSTTLMLLDSADSTTTAAVATRTKDGTTKSHKETKRKATTTTTQSSVSSGNHNNSNTMPPPPVRNPAAQTQHLTIISSLPRIEPTATRFPSSAIAMTDPVQRTLATYRRSRGGGGVGTTTNTTTGMNLEESESEQSGNRRSHGLLDYASSTDASTDLDAPPHFDLPTERILGQRRKEKEWNTMIQMTPLIVPGAGQAPETGVEEEPIMTWGEVAGTPLVLAGRGGDVDVVGGGNDTTADEDCGYSLDNQPAFGVIQSARDRAAEKAWERMEERSRLASSAKRPLLQQQQHLRGKKNKNKLGKDGTSGSLTRASATPGRRPTSILSARMARSSSSARSANSLGTALRSVYSATPLSKLRKKGGGGGSSSGSHLHRATPRLRSGGSRDHNDSTNVSVIGTTLPTSSNKPTKNVTKGLLQLG
jgi:hypothetical protein